MGASATFGSFTNDGKKKSEEKQRGLWRRAVLMSTAVSLFDPQVPRLYQRVNLPPSLPSWAVAAVLTEQE